MNHVFRIVSSLFVALAFLVPGCIDNPDQMEASATDAGVDADAPDEPDTDVFDGCADDLTFCGAPGDGPQACVDLQGDVDHCGGCHHDCHTDVADATPVCDDGVCDIQCQGDLERCGDECVDTESDDDHCGECGTQCPFGDCSAGQCEPPECDIQQSPFGGGDGTAEAPYVVCSVDQFNEIGPVADNVDVHIVLASDIEAADGQQLNTIGTLRGTFDGMGHTIKDFARDDPQANNVAIFGTLYADAAVSNVVIDNPTVTGHHNTGAVAGVNHGTVEHASVYDGTIDGATHTGGVVGQNQGTIVDTTADDTRVSSGTQRIGGLAGTNSGTIESSHTDGATIEHTGTTSHTGFGGLVGRNNGSIRSSSTDDVDVETSGQRTGGLVGYSGGWSVIEDSHAQGRVVGGHHDIGGLAGRVEDDAAITDCSADVATTGDHIDPHHALYIGGLVGRLADDATVDNGQASGNVSADGQGQQIGGLVGRVSEHAEIIDSSASGDVDGDSYQKVGGLVGLALGSTHIEDTYATGNIKARHNFVGGLAGAIRQQAHIESSHAEGTVQVDGLHLEATGGLVGRIANSASVDDSYATGHVTSTAGRVGGLAGDLIAGSTPDGSCHVTGSHATGDVIQDDESNEDYFGGLIGNVDGECEINASFATGDVHAPDAADVGGLVGRMREHAQISRSFATGTVVGENAVGGLTGCICAYHHGWNPRIVDSFATGDATATRQPAAHEDDPAAGGLVGWSFDDGPVFRSYSTGTASTELDDGLEGGLIARDTEGAVTASYWDIDTSGLEDSGGGKGLNTTEFTDVDHFGEDDEQWDFNDIWAMPQESQLDELVGTDVVRPRLQWEFQN